jgi:hypothetical protein
MTVQRQAVQHRPTEWAYASGTVYANPFADVTLDAIVESDGGTWGGEPWQDVARYPGSRQVGICMSLLRRFDWHRFEPRQDWIEPPGDQAQWQEGYAAGIEGEVRVIYLWKPVIPWGDRDAVQVTALEPGVAYDATWLDPRTGAEHAIGAAVGDEQGRWTVPLQPEMSDWVLVLQRADTR